MIDGIGRIWRRPGVKTNWKALLSLAAIAGLVSSPRLPVEPIRVKPERAPPSASDVARMERADQKRARKDRKRRDDYYSCVTRGPASLLKLIRS